MFRGTSARREWGSTDHATVKDPYGDVVIVPHHPDRLRRPSSKPGAHDEEHFLHTLRWNVVRTL